MLLRMNNICKEFPGVRANWCVDLEVAEGEIHALLGENGAGKSTLMNILYGLYVPDKGTVEWMGKEVTTAKTHEALAMGIGMIHQHFMLIPKFTVVENIVLGAWGNDRNPALDIKGAAKRITELSQNYGLEVDPWKLVENLSVGEQQRVAVFGRLGNRFGTDVAIGAAAVVDYKGLAQSFSQLVREYASGAVDTAAGRKRHHHPHRAVRIGLGAGMICCNKEQQHRAQRVLRSAGYLLHGAAPRSVH